MGRAVSFSASSFLADSIDHCGMIDVGFVGPKHTWTNSHSINSLVLERIDRAWIKNDWLLAFPDSTVFHLPRMQSDHCPLLFSTSVCTPCLGEKPFRFQPMWLSDLSFFDVVHNSWAVPNLSYFDSVDLFVKNVKIWKRDHFGFGTEIILVMFFIKNKNCLLVSLGLKNLFLKTLLNSSLTWMIFSVKSFKRCSNKKKAFGP